MPLGEPFPDSACLRQRGRACRRLLRLLPSWGRCRTNYSINPNGGGLQPFNYHGLLDADSLDTLSKMGDILNADLLQTAQPLPQDQEERLAHLKLQMEMAASALHTVLASNAPEEEEEAR